MFTRWSIACGLLSLALPSYTPSPRAMQRDVGAAGSIAVRTATVDGLKLQYLTAGRGPAVVLLHGYAETSLETLTFDAPTAWILGNEAHGLPADVLATVDTAVKIPLYGKAESLNLATAAAVCVYTAAMAAHR